MSVSGASGFHDRVHDLAARLDAIEGSGSSMLSLFDSDQNVRAAIGALAGRATIGEADVERVVREAKDYGDITAAERASLTSLLSDRASAFDPVARAALAQFLGVADPGPGRTATTTPTHAPDPTGGRTGVLTDLGRTSDPSMRAGFRASPQLAEVLRGRARLDLGARGEGVREVQRALTELGFDVGIPDGQLGTKTQAAVREVQRRAGLAQTGAVDGATLEAMSRQLEGAERASFAAHPTLAAVLAGRQTLGIGAGGQAVVEVQRALLDAGFDLGPAGADGGFGGGTKAAVAGLQRKLGLAETGVIDQRTLEALGRAAGTDHRADPRAPLIERSVGPGQPNAVADVAAVQTRLQALGFYEGPINGRSSAALTRALRTFDSVVKDAERVPVHGGARHAAEVLSPGEATDRWLRADNAPRWQRLPASGTGWVNGDRDGHSHATSWLADTLDAVGARYERARAGHADWVPIRTNDASRRHGGDTRDHASHETGLDLDVLLGDGGITFRSRGYDQDETWAKIRAFLDDPNVERVLFNDPELIRRANADPAYRGRLVTSSGHDDHLHVDVRVPARRPA